MRYERNHAIAARFGRQADRYDEHADFQAKVADGLAELLPALPAPRVLEIGCGTGHLTRHLLDQYDDGSFLISDLSEAMVTACRARFGDGQSRQFAVMDGEFPPDAERFDLIATSMAVHWFQTPLEGLQRLRSLLRADGHLVYAALGADSFQEWRELLKHRGLPVGLIEVPPWPGIAAEHRHMVTPENAYSFFRALREMGAATPRSGYKPMLPGEFRSALRLFDEICTKGITWHIVFGLLRP